MRPRSFRLLLHSEQVGVVTAGDDGTWTWGLHDAWLDAPDRPELSLRLRDINPRKTRRADRPPWFLSNLLPEPDGALRRRLARTHGIDETDDAALLALVGQDMSGALQAIPDDDAALPPRPLISEAPQGLFSYRASLGGMQLKFSANLRDRIVLPARGETGRWILKLPSERQPTLPALEAAALSWARTVGFETPDAEVIESSRIEGLPDDILRQAATALVVRRFDRTPEGLRVHMEEINAAMGQHPEQKFPVEPTLSTPSKPSTPTIAGVAKLVRRFAGPDAARDFLLRVLFDALVGNADAHLKNWAFTFPDRRKAALAPVYDVVPTVLLDGFQTLALPLAGHTLFNQSRFTAVTPSAMREVAKKAGLDPSDIELRSRELVARATSTFDDVTAPFDLRDLRRPWRTHLDAVARVWR